MAQSATIDVRILDSEEFKPFLAVASAAVAFMAFAAPVSMDGPQWDAWCRLRDAVEKLDRLA